jgi:hypothetical protein
MIIAIKFANSNHLITEVKNKLKLYSSRLKYNLEPKEVVLFWYHKKYFFLIKKNSIQIGN